MKKTLKKIWNLEFSFIISKIKVRFEIAKIAAISACAISLGQLGIYVLLSSAIGVFLHELGHAIALKYYGAEVKEFHFSIITSYVYAEHDEDLSKAQYSAMLLAGPITNLLLAIAGLVLGGAFGTLLFVVNFMLAIGNLIPMGFTDGHRAISDLLDVNPLDFKVRRLMVSSLVYLLSVFAVLCFAFHLFYVPFDFIKFGVLSVVVTIFNSYHMIERESAL